MLATLTADLLPEVRTAWIWLSELGSNDVDPVAGTWAELEYEALADDDEDAAIEIIDAVDAHLLVRAALLRAALLRPELLRPELLHADGPIPNSLLSRDRTPNARQPRPRTRRSPPSRRPIKPGSHPHPAATATTTKGCIPTRPQHSESSHPVGLRMSCSHV